MRHLFVMDPLEKIQVSGDSTYSVMLACRQRGHDVWMCEPRELFAREGRAGAIARALDVREDAPYFVADEDTSVQLTDFDVVWMRKDPPFDMSYIFATYILDMAMGDTLVVNEPIGLKRFNEKLWAMQYAHLHPPTLLSRNPAQILEFVHELGGDVIMKPWDGNGGRGILKTSATDLNVRSIIEVLTKEHTEAILVQPFLEAIRQGDKRIMLFEGEPVGAMLRVPADNDFRGNMHVGAQTIAAELSERDHEICAALGPALREHGQIWAGIDVIGEFLTEINITSPTGFHEIRRLTGKVLEHELVDIVERMVAGRARG